MFSPRTDHLNNAAKLLTAAAAFAAGPSLGSGTSLYDAARKLARQPPARLATLADEATALAREVVEGFGYDLPPDTDIRFEQMVAATLPEPAFMTARAMDPGRIAADMAAQFTDPDHRAPPMPELFVAIVTPVLARLLRETSIAEEITPAFMAEVLGRLDRQTRLLEELEARYGSLAKALDARGEAARDQLEAIASRFEVSDVHAMSDRDLRRQLDMKAEEYRSFRATIDALDDRVPSIANLKGAAQDAAAGLDFDEVEALLARADEVETEIVSETKVARAQNALLRGDPNSAFRLLSAAADSFGSVDALEPARKRSGYARMLYGHGLRYPGNAAQLAGRMMRAAIHRVPLDADPELWATLQVNLATMLNVVGDRTDDPATLSASIDACQAALSVFTRETTPDAWAAAQTALGNALSAHADRTGDTDALQDSAGAFRAVLGVHTRDRNPAGWARAQNNLGVVLAQLGITTGDTAHIRDAIAAFNAALEIRTRQADPMDWASTQGNLGKALRHLGESLGDADPLDAAVAACRQALEVQTVDEAPLPFVSTSENLALALIARADHVSDPDRGSDLAAALQAVNAAHEVITPKNAPQAHEKLSQLRARILAMRDRCR